MKDSRKINGMESELSHIINVLPGMVWAALPDGQLNFVNQRWCEYTGISFEEACNTGWHTVIHPEDLSAFSDYWQSIIRSGEPGEMETRLRRFDGEYRSFLICCNPQRDEAGQIVKWYGVNTDIEDCRRAEDALRQRELSFRLIVDSIPVPVAVTIPSGEVEGVNQPTLDYFGKTFEELKGWTTSDVVHPDDLQHTIATQREAHEMGSAYNVESRHRRADGVYRWFNVRGFPLRDTEGRILRWFHLLIDIDDRKRAEALLAGEKRLLEMLAGGHSLSIILEALCKLVESTARGCYCSVVLVDHSGTHLEHGTAPSLPESFIKSIIGRSVNVDAGPSATAAYLNEQVIAADLTTETRWANDWCPMALSHGLRACWATPLSSSSGKVLGAFAIYYDKPTALTSFHQSLIEQFRHIASIAVERAQSDAVLKRSEERKAAILNSAFDCIVTIDHEGCITEFNPAAERTFGYRRDEVAGKQLADVIIPVSLRENHREELAGLLATGESRLIGRRVEMTALRADGSEFPVELAITRIPTDGLPSFTGYLRDFTEHNRALEKLRANQDLLDLAQKSARAMAFDWYIQETVNTWSSEQEALYGLTPGTFDGTIESWKKLIHADDWQLILKALKRAYETGDISAEYRVVWPDGSTHWLAANGQMFFDDKGNPYRMVGFTTDVTRRKLVEEELRRSAAFLAEAQRLSSIGSFSWLVAIDEITWSEQLYRIFEFERGMTVTFDLVGTRVHPEDLLLFKEHVERARSDGSDLEFDFRLQMPNHSVKYMHVVAHSSRDENGQLEYIGAVQDVTERRLSEEALSKARSELAHVARVTSLGALTASIAHEVNQPLSGIITNASTCLRMLAAEPPNIDGARETARRTIRDGHRAADVIARLRALFSKKDVTIETVDLNEATREVIALSLSELQSNRVILRTQFTDSLPPVMGDRVQLQQVILNLLRNASDAMSEVNDRPRQLIVRTKGDDVDQVCLTVQDAGMGFGPQEVDRLFDAFYTTKNGGMGIGLSVSRSIIESHNGRIWASQNDGPGATFSFSIPRSSEAVTSTPGVGAIHPPALTKGTHVGRKK